MSKPYAPPYTLSSTIVHRVAEICEALGRFAAALDVSAVRLRRINRIHTIQGSLAIEGNTLDVAQITAILDGKRVLAPPRQIQEVRNAIKAYDRLLPILEPLHPDRKAVQPPWRAESEADLLEAHATLMAGLLDAPGNYRDGGVGVMAGTCVIHMAPPASRVVHLMQDLLGWVKSTNEHPLIVSAVFHYEFEFIHPFSDGNGRMGRLWQSLILSQWNPVFAQIPVESLIHEHQQAYYNAIQRSTQNADSAAFIEFMLDMIAQALPTATPQVSPQVSPQVAELIHVLVGEMKRDELQLALGLLDRKSFVARYLKPALAAGLVEYTRPEQPTSRLQKYRLSSAGQRMAGK
jgi:Fic family protein